MQIERVNQIKDFHHFNFSASFLCGWYHKMCSFIDLGFPLIMCSCDMNALTKAICMYGDVTIYIYIYIYISTEVSVSITVL